MLTVLIRTLIVYVLLTATMRIMGKRQLGELEISELVTTLLISEIAILPIGDPELPFVYAVIPLVTILSLEVFLSTILLKCPKLKNVVSPRPNVLIRHGKLDQKEMERNRISIDELISEVRQKSLTSLEEVDYAILEHSDEIYVFPADFGWSGLGTWGSLHAQMDKDLAGNVAIGPDITLYESRGCVVHTTEEKKVVIIGLEGYIVAENGDQLLICKLDDEQRIKEFSDK